MIQSNVIKYTICLLGVVGSSASGATADGEEKHFRHLMFRESPYAPYRGIYPIDEASSETSAHYEFAYDKKGRVIRISRKIADARVGGNGVFDSFIWFAPEVRIVYGDKTETHTYYDINGDQTTAHGGVYSAVYTLNDAGKRTGLAFFDADGAPTASEWRITRYEWRSSDDGHIFEKRFNSDGEQERFRPSLHFYETKLEYDADGKIEYMRNYGTDHTPTNNVSGAGIDRITYDLKGNFIRWQVYDKDGNAVEGNRPNVHLGEHLYDEYGNKIALRGFDRHGAPMSFSWGEILQLKGYDSFGNQAEIKSIAEDGSLNSHIKWQYSTDGRRVEVGTSYDKTGKIANHSGFGRAAILKFSYDEKGIRTHKPFNADGTPFDPDA